MGFRPSQPLGVFGLGVAVAIFIVGADRLDAIVAAGQDGQGLGVSAALQAMKLGDWAALVAIVLGLAIFILAFAPALKKLLAAWRGSASEPHGAPTATVHGPVGVLQQASGQTVEQHYYAAPPSPPDPRGVSAVHGEVDLARFIWTKESVHPAQIEHVWLQLVGARKAGDAAETEPGGGVIQRTFTFMPHGQRTANVVLHGVIRTPDGGKRILRGAWSRPPQWQIIEPLSLPPTAGAVQVSGLIYVPPGSDMGQFVVDIMTAEFVVSDKTRNPPVEVVLAEGAAESFDL